MQLVDMSPVIGAYLAALVNLPFDAHLDRFVLCVLEQPVIRRAKNECFLAMLVLPSYWLVHILHTVHV